MAVTAACFKWADVLENQFDKSWVELDTILCQLEDDEVRCQMFPDNLHLLVFSGLCGVAPAGQESRHLPGLLLLSVCSQVDHRLPGSPSSSSLPIILPICICQL